MGFEVQTRYYKRIRLEKEALSDGDRPGYGVMRNVPPNIHVRELRISGSHCHVILCLFIIVIISINEI